ncbi:hypothetical protein GQ55_5G545200 [Panicum hallii var. hallii]|uniref:Uncharacterized protein n=1 Tax=Panicum hallii var. hallii TaxID=1504633 RepID=A0A2T7DTL0_9POAL|nr:hypothetical protein GQ55_5G545200 [Panicum hallii var. hallii]
MGTQRVQWYCSFSTRAVVSPISSLACVWTRTRVCTCGVSMVCVVVLCASYVCTLSKKCKKFSM